MDVSAIASGTGTPAPTAADNSTANAQAAGQSQPIEAQPQQGQQIPGTSQSAGLAPVIAKLFGSGSNPTPITLNVSYRVVKGLDDRIVTVFSDPKTGKEVAQFPPEILIGLAEFFDHQSGATLDQSA